MEYQGVFRVYFMSETAQVELKHLWTSASPCLAAHGAACGLRACLAARANAQPEGAAAAAVSGARRGRHQRVHCWRGPPRRCSCGCGCRVAHLQFTSLINQLVGRRQPILPHASSTPPLP